MKHTAAPRSTGYDLPDALTQADSRTLAQTEIDTIFQRRVLYRLSLRVKNRKGKPRTRTCLNCGRARCDQNACHMCLRAAKSRGLLICRDRKHQGPRMLSPDEFPPGRTYRCSVCDPHHAPIPPEPPETVRERLLQACDFFDRRSQDRRHEVAVALLVEFANPNRG